MTTSLALLKASSAGVNRSDTACPAPSPSDTASSASCPVAEGVADISVCRSVICSQGDCSMADSRASNVAVSVEESRQMSRLRSV